MKKRQAVVEILAPFLAVFMLAVPAAAGGAPDEAPTFTKDVAPILFENCVTCHRPGNIAPMSLTSYIESRPWARSIKDLVVSRTMPPWPPDPDNSLKFRNERHLDQAEIDTIVAWVDGGAPKGNDADLPPLPDFPEGWTYEGGDPDYVFELPVEYEVPAEGEEDYIDFYTKVPFEEDRFAEVLEMRPSNYAVVHHSGAYVVDLPAGKMVGQDGLLLDDPNAVPDGEQEAGAGAVAQAVFNEVNLPGTSKLLSYVPGRGVERHRPGTGKRVTAGKWIRWTMHYNPTGKPERGAEQAWTLVEHRAGEARGVDAPGGERVSDRSVRDRHLYRRRRGDQADPGRERQVPARRDP